MTLPPVPVVDSVVTYPGSPVPHDREENVAPGEVSAASLMPELVIHHEQFLAALPLHSRWISIYTGAAQWASGNAPAHQIAVPPDAPRTGETLIELIGQ